MKSCVQVSCGGRRAEKGDCNGDIVAWMMALMSSFVEGFESIVTSALRGAVDGSGGVGFDNALEPLSWNDCGVQQPVKRRRKARRTKGGCMMAVCKASVTEGALWWELAPVECVVIWPRTRSGE